MKIAILASQNKKKIKEIRGILIKYGMDVIARDDAGLPPDDIEETGSTFEANSMLKAKSVMEMIKADPVLMESYAESPVIADDSGLMVEALGGAPGVYSARYAGEEHDYAANNEKLLRELDGIPMDKRKACFVTVITMIYPDGSGITARGECPGHITDKLRGEGGFGYDPLFVPDGYDKTFAELGSELKNTISHRARALAELERILDEAG